MNRNGRTCDVTLGNDLGHTLVDGRFRSCLQFHIKCGHDLPPTALEGCPALVLGCAEGGVVLDDPGDVVTEEGSTTSCLAASAGRSDHRSDRLGYSGLVFLVGDLAFSKHAAQYVVTTLFVVFHVLRNIDTQVVGVVHGGDEACCLSKGEVLGLDAEVILRSRFDAIYATTEGSDVEVTVENLVFGVLGLDADRQLHFLELALNGGLGGCVVGSLTSIGICNLLRTHHQDVLHVLLADRRTTLYVTTGGVGNDGACSTDEVHTTVLIKTRVFCCDSCVNDEGRNFFQGNRNTVLRIERGEQNF